MIEELSNEAVDEIGGGFDDNADPSGSGGLNIFDSIWDYWKRTAPADVTA